MNELTQNVALVENDQAPCVHTHTKFRVNIDADPDWVEAKRKHMVSWRHIISLGIRALEGNPQLLERISALEDDNRHLRDNISRYQQRVVLLEDKMHMHSCELQGGHNV